MTETYKIDRKVLHGTSFSVSLDTVEFMTWRRNEDTGDYWVKFHIPSGKEIRIKVSASELEDIHAAWCGYDVDLGSIDNEEEEW